MGGGGILTLKQNEIVSDPRSHGLWYSNQMNQAAAQWETNHFQSSASAGSPEAAPSVPCFFLTKSAGRGCRQCRTLVGIPIWDKEGSDETQHSCLGQKLRHHTTPLRLLVWFLVLILYVLSLVSFLLSLSLKFSVHWFCFLCLSF